MSLLSRESIKIIAESVGIENLSNEVAIGLASDVEYRLREIIQASFGRHSYRLNFGDTFFFVVWMQEAIKFMRHSKRERMTTEDINNALRLRNVEVRHISFFPSFC